MIFPKKPKYCLVTITSPNFITGTLVMLHTFLKYNQWFRGDILVYSTDLNEAHKDLLRKFPNLKFIEPHQELVRRIQQVVRAHPRLAHKHMVFYSLNIFKGLGYQKYFYIDSDAFFQDSIEELMDHDHGLMCVGDRATYLGKAKDRDTYQIAQNPDKSEKYWYRTFNAGILFIDKKITTRKVYSDLLDLVNPDNYESLHRPTTDQYLLNSYFRKSYHRLPASYNYRLGIAREVCEQEGITLDNAKIIHFTGQKNPWNSQHVIKAVARFDLYYQAFTLWNNEYMDLLQRLKSN